MKHEKCQLFAASKEVEMFDSTERRLFRDNIYEDESSCWLWRGRKDHHGYGRFNAGGKNIPAHKYSFEYFKGPLPEGLEIHHKCRIRNCVKPTHLEPVTHRENMQLAAMDRAYSGSRNSQAKYTEADVKAVRRMRKNGVPVRKISQQKGIPERTVYYMLKEGWKHV